MQQLFQRWYSSTSFQSEPETVQQRWGGVSGVAKAPSKEQLALLARLAFRLKVNLAASDVAALRDSFAGGGPVPTDEELYVLSASALAVAMDIDSPKLSPMAALTVSCVSCAGLRSLPQQMDLVGMSENALQKLADTERRRPSLEQGRLQTPATEAIDTATTTAMSNGEWSAAFKGLFATTNRALEKMASRQRAFEAATQRYVTVQDEELDMLWWLQGGHSFHAAQDFPEVPVEQRPLLMSYELATLTKVLPGPPALEALLTRTGVLETPKLPIATAVQGMSAAWLQSVAESVDAGTISAHLAPILFAIVRRHEAGGTDEWIGPWATATGIARDTALDPVKLALAAYREFVRVKLGN